MKTASPLLDAMRRRFSCRTFSGVELAREPRARLSEAVEAARTGPFGSRLRFRLVAADAVDRGALRGLGTYGTIRGATAFILGAAERGPGDMEDYGYALERLVLHATTLGLGSCWLGGFFARGTFARRIGMTPKECIPAVVALGMIADRERAGAGLIRRGVGGSRRLPRHELFFREDFGRPLEAEDAGLYDEALEMVRLAPSASNRQPWRILKSGRRWHFFLRRTPGYPPRIGRALLRLEDLQRVDMGIALSHFEIAARETGRTGRWETATPTAVPTEDSTEYCVTWVDEGGSP